VMIAAWPTAVPVVATSATRSCSGTFHIPAMSASCSPSPLPLAYPTAPTATRCLCTPPLVWNPLLCCHEILPACLPLLLLLLLQDMSSRKLERSFTSLLYNLL
jgi:hypothetical protein